MEIKLRMYEGNGQLKTIKESARQMRIDSSDPKYIDIEHKLIDLALKFHLTKDLAFEASEKHDVLEETLMLYHHEKMKAINR